MLQNACLLAKIGADTAENEQHFAEILPKTGNYPTGPTSDELAPGACTVVGPTEDELRAWEYWPATWRSQLSAPLGSSAPHRFFVLG